MRMRSSMTHSSIRSERAPLVITSVAQARDTTSVVAEVQLPRLGIKRAQWMETKSEG